jgi:hypothetical protein
VTPDRAHDAADLEPAALELAPGEHVTMLLPSAGRVTAGGRGAPASLLAGLAGDRPGCPVALERTAARDGTAGGRGSGRRHAVSCYLVRRQV